MLLIFFLGLIAEGDEDEEEDERRRIDLNMKFICWLNIDFFLGFFFLVIV